MVDNRLSPVKRRSAKEIRARSAGENGVHEKSGGHRPPDRDWPQPLLHQFQRLDLNDIALLLAGHIYPQVVFLAAALQELCRFLVTFAVEFEVLPVLVNDAEAALGAGQRA